MQPNANQYLPSDYEPPGSNHPKNKQILIIALTIVAIILGGVAIWGVASYLSLKGDFDQKVTSRIEEAKTEQRKEDQAEFEAIQKSPFRTYESPGFVGDLTLKYPKNWSLYVEENERGSKQLDAVAHPKIIPAGSVNEDLGYAFRFELRSELYDDALNGYESRIESGNAKARAIKVNGILSTRIEGELASDVNGTVVLVPIRDKTLFLFNENPKYLKDFNQILKEANISP